MNSFTRGEVPEDVIAEALPFKYKMELTRGDMLKLLELMNIQLYEPSAEVQEWAGDMRSSILTTIDIEEV